ncbi:MAG: 6-carboxytetrahydropterin synthase [Fimbriimonadaceae bacterium]|nr:6-carboxytetrahydropterin synthase [Fimbriimonadaceae bacterium]
MEVTISKEFRWEMGHRLPGHPLCGSPHGHSYRLIVEVTGEPDASGMVMDYGLMSEVVKPIIQQLDHSFFVDPDDKIMAEVIDKNGFKKCALPFRSTAENIAAWILEQIAPTLPENVREAVVTVCETERTSATVVFTR